MLDPLQLSIQAAGSGLEAQSHRVRVVAENLANYDSTGNTPGAAPYTRKTITFVTELDRQAGISMVRTERIGLDPTPYPKEYNPTHPAADAEGMVKRPNVNLIIELADMREANRSYEANLQVIKQAREMINATIDLLRT